ncbi:M20 family metallo-hydrolase [Natronolimnobius sp. AArcel1]|uniref:M20 family metallo-hydrolase n=1 Tax=Natronolimnobius sp. AArcel1 TaxID=1679093 RepID=UPI0013EA3D36|nr:M20 family metallo-hydrolase [Natronolimnobius sp. AArcel1]NGM71276.1 M20 family metallo-hydrolase [Natronolimnobius sp. AArcel1]
MIDQDIEIIDRAIEAVDPDRLQDDIEANAKFGEIQTDVGRGRTVLPGTDANRRAREYFLDRLADIGLDTRIDSVGNIVGRYVPSAVEPSTAPVAAGSHLDSVPRGGIFDGPLGVYGALEAVRAIEDAGVSLTAPIDIVSFTEEEGHRFTDGVLGSSVAAGTLPAEAALETTDEEGTTLREALEEIGFHGRDRIDVADWDTWFELHVEQGSRLENAALPVGIVTDIVGTIRCHVRIEGEANHSGTTSMDDRVDALVPASELVAEIETIARELSTSAGGTTVATVGDLAVEPGASNVIPGTACLSVDIRDTNYANMEAIVDRINTTLTRLESERDVVTSLESSYDIEPIQMSDRCRTALRQTATQIGTNPLELHSGAGHDTMQVARKTDAGLLFVQSTDGISHTPKEWTDWDICEAGVKALTGAMVRTAADSTRYQ